MKKLITILLIVVATNAFSQSIYYQAVAKDANNNLVANKSIFVQTSILDSRTSTVPLYTELFSVSTDGFGMFGVNIGAGTKAAGSANSIMSIDWAGTKYLNIKVYFGASMPLYGNSEWIDAGTTTFGAVPYAIYAATASDIHNASLLTKINQKLNATDTLGLSYRINQKLNIADTIGLFANYYSKRQVDSIVATIYTSSNKHYLGETYGGGVIFYLESDSAHGLIAATQDGINGANQTISGTWYADATTESAVVIGAIKDGLYAGQSNTERLVSFQPFKTTQSAAQEVAYMAVNNYGDWYLPSLIELQTLFKFNSTKSNILNIKSGAYWSSTEANLTQAYSYNGSTQAQSKSTTNFIRAIRKF